MAVSAPFVRAPSVPSAVGLVVANLVPLVGVLFFGWSLFGVMWLYWAENGVIGAFALLRILTAGEGHGQKLVMGPFFTVHYGMFWTVHGVFLVSLFGTGGAGEATPALWDIGRDLQFEGLLALVLSHGASFALNYLGRGEWRATSPGAEMAKPYGRVVLLHVVILAGGFLIESTGAGVLALALFVGLKTALDLGVHLAGHRMRYRALDQDEPDPAATTLHLDVAPDRRADEGAVPLAVREPTAGTAPRPAGAASPSRARTWPRAGG